MSALHLQDFDNRPHRDRRAQLAQDIRAMSSGARAVVLIPTALEVVRNRDAYYDFRPDSYFYYLTGFTEPEAFLVMIIDGDSVRSALFCREKNLLREIWDGYRLGPDSACTYLGVDEAYSVERLVDLLPVWLQNTRFVFAPMAQAHLEVEGLLRQALLTTRTQVRSGATAPSAFHDVYALIDEMRLRKDSSELAWMQAAGEISAAGHVRAMQQCRVGACELDLEAEIRYEFMRRGAQNVAYNTIVAAGANACVLHYRAGLAPLKSGDLCLIDAGAEYGYYAGDITRTFPINGVFSPAQRAIYELVLAAQTKAIELTRIGVAFDEPHQAVVRILTQGLLDLNILDANRVGSVEDAMHNQAYQAFFMHRTGHWLGLDVHDCGAYSSGQIESMNPDSQTMVYRPVYRALEQGMVLTVEPGLYIRPCAEVPEQFWNIGVRIEDDVVVTEQGCSLLTRDVPVEVDEIEALMRHR